MRGFVIAGMKALIAMICLVLAFVIWASIFDGYPWRERFLGLLYVAAAPFVLWIAIRLLEDGRRSGAVLGLLCVLIGPTPMFLEATWIWWPLLGIPLVVVWFQLSTSDAPDPPPTPQTARQSPSDAFR